MYPRLNLIHTNASQQSVGGMLARPSSPDHNHPFHHLHRHTHMSTQPKRERKFKYISTHERLAIGQIPFEFAPISRSTREYLGVEKKDVHPSQILNTYCFDMAREATPYDEGGFSFTEIGGQPIGFFVGYLHFMRGDAMDWPEGDGVDRPWLGDPLNSRYSRGLSVHPDYRGQGVANGLISSIVRAFPDGRLVARLTEEKLISVFSRHGFAKLRLNTTPDGTKVHTLERGKG